MATLFLQCGKAILQADDRSHEHAHVVISPLNELAESVGAVLRVPSRAVPPPRHSSTEGYAGNSGARPSCVSQSCTSK